jgi:hypothetical protein
VPSHHNLSLEEQKLLSHFREVNEEERQTLLQLLQSGILSDSLIFKGKTFEPNHPLYKIINQIKDEDRAFLKKIQDNKPYKQKNVLSYLFTALRTLFLY